MNGSLLRLVAVLMLALGAAWGPQAARAQVLDPTNPNAVNPAAPPVVRPDTARIRKPTLADKRKKNAEDSLRRTEKFFGIRVTPLPRPATWPWCPAWARFITAAGGSCRLCTGAWAWWLVF